MIVADPGATPVTSPPATVAKAVLLLDHDAVPVVASVNTVVPPTHTVVVPSIGVGPAITVTGIVTKHPEPSV